MKTIINNASKIMGMFGIMLAMAVMLIGAPAASANRIPTQGKITVYVSNAATGAQLPKATVAVYDVNTPSNTPVLMGTTNERGEFASYIRTGSFKVIVSAEGFAQDSQSVTIRSGEGVQIKSALQPEFDDTATAAVPVPAADGTGLLHLNVVDASTGKAVADATVVIYDASGNAIAKATTDSNGYHAVVLPPGDYKVQVIAYPYADFREAFAIAGGGDTAVTAKLITNHD